MNKSDIVVIGAGPAGMAAATTAATHNASVTLLDEQTNAGGQIYRAIDKCSANTAKILGEEYSYGKKLTKELSESTVEVLGEATVFKIDHDTCISYIRNNKAAQIHAGKVIIATGALERSNPLPGWTLPGVMTAGAAQIMLKSHGMVIEQAVLAGTGPLLYTVAQQLINAGYPPKAIIDTISLSHYRRAARYFPFTSIDTISKGLAYLRNIKRAKIPHYTAARNIRINGQLHVRDIQFERHGKTITIETDNCLLHQGVVPNTQLSRSLQLKHQWSCEQRCFYPVTDRWGVTSHPDFLIAGDGGFIGGAISAEQQGKVVALGALAAINKITTTLRDSLANPSQKILLKNIKLRKFLDTLYAPPEQWMLPADDTIVCRCEEVTAGNIRSYARIGCSGPNQTKAFGRCGMGPCQGRYCGLTVTELLADENGLNHDTVGSYRIRSPIKPVTLAQLATLASVHRMQVTGRDVPAIATVSTTVE